MRRRGARRRRQQGSRSLIDVILYLGLVVAVIVALTGPPGAAYTTGQFGRATSIDAVADIDGVVKLNTTSELQEGTNDQCLVRITNYLGKEVTANVSLRNDSTHLGELRREDDILGLQRGDTLEFPLADGESKTVFMDVETGTAGNTTYFHVTATATGLSVELNDRSAPIVQTGDTTCA